MSKILIIIQREFFTRIQKKSFIILTILMPFIIAGVAVTPFLLASIKDDTQHTVMLVDKTHKYAPLFEDNESYHFVTAPEVLPEFREEDSPVKAVILISEDLMHNPQALKMYSLEEVPADLQRLTENILSEKVRADKLAQYNVEGLAEIIAEAETEISAQTVKWTDDGGETSSDSGIALGVGFLFTFIIYMFVMAYGGMVMQSVMEEKTNRIMEIIVSSVKPFQLMMGKILGIASVAITQFAIWVVFIIVVGAGALSLLGGTEVLAAAAQAGTGMDTMMASMGGISLDKDTVALINTVTDPAYLVRILGGFLIYFVGGYLLYAAMFAAVGSAVDNEKDTNNLQLPITIPLILALFVMMNAMQEPNGPLAVWFSMIPFTSPIVMMVRLPYGVPEGFWISVALLYATFFATVWLAGKIYRIGVFMYGKKPTFGELLKWIRYKS